MSDKTYYQMARLNPKAGNLAIGSGGGKAETTPQDVAAALAFTQRGIGRELLQLVGNPDGASLVMPKIESALESWMRAEIVQRESAAQKARLELHMAKEEASKRRFVTDEDRREIKRCERRYADALAQCWPRKPEMYPKIRKAILLELAKPHHCPKCCGQKEVMTGELKVACESCKGRGAIQPKGTDRAKSVGLSEAGFRLTWAALYEYVMCEMRDAILTAESEFEKALG